MHNSHISPGQPAFWTRASLCVTFEPAADPSEQVLRLDRPFTIVSCDSEGEVHLSNGPDRQRIVYLHGTTHGVFAVTLAASKSGGKGPRGNWVNTTDELRIGGALLRTWVEGDGVAKSAEADRPNLLSPLSSPDEVSRLEIVSAGSKGRRIVRRLRSPLTVLGRGPQTRIRIDDPSVSSVHCVLYQEAGRLWVIDLMSKNGTSLNGINVHAAEVSPGDLIALGSVRVRWLGPLTDKLNDFSVPQTFDRPDPSGVVESVREELLGTERTNEGGAGNAASSPSIPVASRNERLGTLQRQLDEFQASLEAISRESAQRDQSLEEMQQSLRDQRESEGRVLEALEGTERRWSERLDDLQTEMASARAENDRRYEETQQSLETGDGRLRDMRQNIDAQQAADRQQAKTQSASAQQIEASGAELSKAVRAIEGLEETSQQLSQSYERADQRINEEIRRRESAEKTQETLHTRLEELRQQAADMRDSLGRLHCEFDAQRTRQDDVLSALRTAVDAVQEKLTTLSEGAEDHHRLLQSARSEGQEIADRLSQHHQELVARVEAIEASFSARLEELQIGVFAEVPTIGVTGFAPEVSASLGNASSNAGQADFEQRLEREPSGRETSLSFAQGNVAANSEVAEETTDRILDRQHDLDGVIGGRWRKRLRGFIAAMLRR